MIFRASSAFVNKLYLMRKSFSGRRFSAEILAKAANHLTFHGGGPKAERCQMLGKLAKAVGQRRDSLLELLEESERFVVSGEKVSLAPASSADPCSDPSTQIMREFLLSLSSRKKMPSTKKRLAEELVEFKGDKAGFEIIFADSVYYGHVNFTGTELEWNTTKMKNLQERKDTTNGSSITEWDTTKMQNLQERNDTTIASSITKWKMEFPVSMYAARKKLRKYLLPTQPSFAPLTAMDKAMLHSIAKA